MHDPSTVVVTASSRSTRPAAVYRIAISDDGWAWRRAGTLMQALPGGRPEPEVIARGGNTTWAPDVIRSGDKHYRPVKAISISLADR